MIRRRSVFFHYASLALPLAAVLGLGTSCADEEPEPDNHGSVYLFLDLDADTEGNLNPSLIKSITVQTRFNTCVNDFYDLNPEWAPDGFSGTDVWAEWADRLCDDGDASKALAACEISSLTERDLVGGGSGHRIIYNITDAQSQLGNYHLRIGPIPTEDLAVCSGVPGIELSMSDVVGKSEPDGQGDTVFTASVVAPDKLEVDQGGAATVELKQVDGL